MKILLDTNILLSAFLTSGYVHEIMRDAVHRHELYYTEYILREFQDKLKNKFHYSETLIGEFVHFIRHFLVLGKTATAVEKVCRDSNDDQILADAVINTVDIVLSGDQDLIGLVSYKGIKILHPKDYWML